MDDCVGTSFQLVPGKGREAKYMPGITWVIVSARLIVANDSSFEVNGGDLVHEIVAKELCKDKNSTIGYGTSVLLAEGVSPSSG